jgi:protease I
MADELNGKKIAFLMDNEGVEQVELEKPLEAIREAGAEVDVIAPKAGGIQAFDHLDKGDTFDVDKTVSDADAGDYDGVLLQDAVEFLRAFFEAGKPVAAICHAPWMLVEAGVVEGREVTSWPSLRTDLENAGAKWVDEEVVTDSGLVTSRKPDDIPAFTKKAIEEFGEGVHSEQAEKTEQAKA